jgi:hypothetical protein
MMWKVFFALALLLTAEAQDNRRRRIKKKILVPVEESAGAETEYISEVTGETGETASEEMNKSGRG